MDFNLNTIKKHTIVIILIVLGFFGIFLKAKSSSSNQRPLAIPLITQEEAEIANRGAKMNYKTSHTQSAQRDVIAIDRIPFAIPVLSQEEADTINAKAIKYQQNIIMRSRITSLFKRFKMLLKRYSIIFILVPLILIFQFYRKNDTQIESFFSSNKTHSTITSVFLLIFGFTVFIPWNVYFGNIADFPFIFRDFVISNIIIALLLTIALCFLLYILSFNYYKYVVAIIYGLGLCIYAQAMFMNYYIGIMNGVELEWTKHIIWGTINILIWMVIISTPLIVSKFYSKHWSTIVFIVDIILVMEVLGVLSMVMSANHKAWKRDVQTFCDASNQFQLSQEKNIIVIIFDALSYDFTRLSFEADPLLKVAMKDFTWYVDAQSNYNVTFLGLPHEMTGAMVEPSKDLESMFKRIWHKPSAKSFYNQIKHNGFDARMYVKSEANIGSYDIFEEYFSNLIREEIEYNIDYLKLYHCLFQMSGFSSMPYFLKHYFYYGDDFSSSVVTQTIQSNSSDESIVVNTNDGLYKKMISSGISIDAKSPIFSFYYTRGAHGPWNTDEKCLYHQSSVGSFLPPARGCYYFVSELIRLLKENGIYDQTAILICSDHGHVLKDISTVFGMTLMIKPFFANNNEIIKDLSKVQSIDILPLLLEIACGDHADYSSFEGFAPSKIPVNRHRKIYTGMKREEYPDFIGVDGNPHFVNVLKECDYETDSFIKYIPLSTVLESCKTLSE